MRSAVRLAFLHGISWLGSINPTVNQYPVPITITTRNRVPINSLTMSQNQRPTFLSAAVAAEVDKRLMGDIGYSLDQLMELAGQAVAVAVNDYASRLQEGENTVNLKERHTVVVCGPGNNGGDGLVCARHLTLMGYKVSIICPKNKFPSLTRQLEVFHVPFVDEIPSDAGIIIDAIFGFSFKGPSVREPFLSLIQEMNRRKSTCKVICVDVPSGWHVDQGNMNPESAVDTPDALVSLTAPKLCAKSLPESCSHYVGGRFVPPSLCSELDFDLPIYPGSSPIVLL